MLCHYGETKIEQTLRQYFWWLNMHNDLHETRSKYDTCQHTKLSLYTLSKTTINRYKQSQKKQKILNRYHVGDKILYMSKYSENPYDGLYAIVHTKHQWYCTT